jgi:hypothetical protein
MVKKPDPPLAGTEQEVKLSLLGTGSYRLPGTFEIGEKVRLSITAEVIAFYSELSSSDDDGPHTTDHVRLRTTRLVKTK